MIIHGDCLDEMKKMEDNSISCICTDPPYGLSFMGKGWDHAVPGVEYWRECLRLLKPGGFICAMGGSRTFHRLCCAIEDAGFEIRDCVMWLYGQGFPKSHNGFGHPGMGTALKPAHEPIILGMKSCDGTFRQNAEKWGQAGINIDGCRISIDSKDSIYAKNPHTLNKGENEVYGGFQAENTPYTVPKGRWPANVIFDEEAAKMLDEQSGPCKTGDLTGQPRVENKIYGKAGSTLGSERFYKSDAATGASRFFYCAKTSSRERSEGLEGMPEKVSNPNYGSGGFSRPTNQPERETKPSQNHHPTVKPLKLMRYLITLIMPPKDGILLDPFAGSGSTIIAAHQLGVKAIGIEKQAEYVEIANKRLEYYKGFKEENEPDLFDQAHVI